jgi:hypothetical protein
MKAQISVDFIIASLVAISLFFVIFSLYTAKSQGASAVMASLESQRIGENIAWSINCVSRGGDGATEELFIPESVRGEGYRVTVESRWVEVVWQHGGEENHMSVPLMTNNTKGKTFGPSSHLSITNRGGTVEVS